MSPRHVALRGAIGDSACVSDPRRNRNGVSNPSGIPLAGHLVESTREGITIPAAGKAVEIDRVVNTIKQRTRPGDIVLNLGESPIFHLLSGRPGPGFLDVIMPATFLDAAEERAFVERVAANPPAVVIWPHRPFDGMPSRGITATAPQLAAWVEAHYERIPRPQRRWALMFPRHPRATHGGGSPR